MHSAIPEIHSLRGSYKAVSRKSKAVMTSYLSLPRGKDESKAKNQAGSQAGGAQSDNKSINDNSLGNIAISTILSVLNLSGAE